MRGGGAEGVMNVSHSREMTYLIWVSNSLKYVIRELILLMLPIYWR